MKKKRRLLSLFIVLAFLISGCTNKNVDDYLQTGTDLDIEAKSMMPILEQLPAYKRIEYRHTQKNRLLFETNSVVLDVEYDEQIFQKEKMKIVDNINDLSNSFSIKSYDVYIIEDNGFPKSFGMIGISEELQRIAYLYFYDFDLDRIGQANGLSEMPQFIKDNFDYDFK